MYLLLSNKLCYLLTDGSLLPYVNFQGDGIELWSYRLGYKKRSSVIGKHFNYLEHFLAVHLI
jgi:hypothetical protein